MQNSFAILFFYSNNNQTWISFKMKNYGWRNKLSVFSFSLNSCLQILKYPYIAYAVSRFEPSRLLSLEHCKNFAMQIRTASEIKYMLLQGPLKQACKAREPPQRRGKIQKLCIHSPIPINLIKTIQQIWFCPKE